MSRITPDNLDKWLFNLNEGNLTSSEKRELDSFLAQNPEYSMDADSWESSSVSEPLVPVSYEAELHAIATGNSFFTYRKMAVAATLLLLLGGSAFFIFFGSDDSENAEKNISSLFNNQNQNTIHDNTITQNNNTKDTNPNELISENRSNGIGFGQQSIVALNEKEDMIDSYQASTEFTSNENSDQNDSELKKNPKSRKQVSIDIKNEFNIKTEKTYEIVNENIPSEKNSEKDMLTEDERFAIDSENKVKLSLKENANIHVISENKNNIANKDKRRKDRYKLDPNPSFTNLRDPQLLLTNNHLIDQYSGFSGGMIASRFSLNYRNNWTGSRETNSQNVMMSYDKLIRKLKTGVGLTAYYNDYSSKMFTTMGAALTISPKFKLGRGTSLEPAVTFSYAQKNANMNRTNPGNFIEDRRGNVLELYRNGITPAATSVYIPDMKIGAVLQHKKFWAATSIDHLFTPKESLYSTESHLYKNGIEFKITAGTDYLHRPESGNVFSPQVTFYHHDGITEMWLGTQARFKQFSIGASLSQLQDYLATIGYQTHSFKIFYQYDMTRSYLMNEKIASHEIGMRFALNGNNRNSKSILNNER